MGPVGFFIRGCRPGGATALVDQIALAMEYIAKDHVEVR
jgi:hypothetical protein